jgi:hypothetical protein
MVLNLSKCLSFPVTIYSYMLSRSYRYREYYVVPCMHHCRQRPFRQSRCEDSRAFETSDRCASAEPMAIGRITNRAH